MATIQQIHDRIFYDQDLFLEYMEAVSNGREAEFFLQQGCSVTPQELEEYHQMRRGQPGYHPAVKPLLECPPFSEKDFFASLPSNPQEGRQPSDQRKTLRFIE